jgi:hypothetical protein
MEFKYSKRYTNPYLKMKIKEHYTTSLILCILDTVQDDEEIEEDVNHRIQTKWIKWKNTLDVICTVKLHSNVMKVSLHSYKTVLQCCIKLNIGLLRDKIINSNIQCCRDEEAMIDERLLKTR